MYVNYLHCSKQYLSSVMRVNSEGELKELTVWLMVGRSVSDSKVAWDPIGGVLPCYLEFCRKRCCKVIPEKRARGGGRKGGQQRSKWRCQFILKLRGLETVLSL